MALCVKKNKKSGYGLRMIAIEDKSLTSNLVAVMNSAPEDSGIESKA